MNTLFIAVCVCILWHITTVISFTIKYVNLQAHSYCMQQCCDQLVIESVSSSVSQLFKIPHCNL